MPAKDDYLIPEWHAPANVRAFVSTKTSSPNGPPMNGRKDPAYETLRQAWLSSWNERLLGEWQWHQPPCWATQVHGVAVIPATAPYGTNADVVWIDQPNIPCTVLTADCLPVIFCNSAGTKVAAAHAGWRGLAGGVLENTVAAMKEPAGEIMAWLGPAISQSVFEVGPEVREAFVGAHPQAVDAFKAGKGDRWFADLYMLARQRLYAVGVTDISGGDDDGFCTFSNKEKYHSYRRDGAESGRLLTAVWIE